MVPDLFRQLKQSLDEYRETLSESTRDFGRLILVIIILGAIGSLVWWQGRPAWNSWRQEKALNQVETFAEEGDFRNALLALRRATESDPSDPRVWREAATFLARIGSSESLVAHRNLARLDPGDVGVQIALVTEALRFDDLATARNGLEKLESAGRADAAFHRLAAAVALALNKQEEFVDQLKKLVAVDPTDSRALLQLAAIELWSEDQSTSDHAWTKLDPLLTAPEVRLRVALERLNFVAQGRNSEKVDQEVAKLLLIFQPATTKQQIVRDQPNEPPGWNQLLHALGEVAESDAGDAARFINWLSSLGLETRASTWIRSLSEEIKDSPDVLNAELVLAAKLNDLDRLYDLLTNERLSHIPSGTISLLIASRLQETRFDPARGIATWNDALNMSNDSLPGLRIMAQLAGIWGNQDGSILALERIISRFPRELWAYDALRFIYASREESDKLWQIYEKWAPRVPENMTVRQTWLMLAALLNKVEREHTLQAKQWATQAESAGGIELASALATVGVLWRNKLFAEADSVMEKLNREDSNHPRAHLWRLVLAAEQGQTGALKFAQQRFPQADFLREESLIMQNAIYRYEQRADAQRRLEQGALNGVGNP